MVEITESVALVRIGVSLLLGAAIGIERELHNHPAGLRTFTIVSIGSTLAMLVSIYICQQNTDLLNGDPGRIAAQVVTGIGFIGAGLIMKNADGVSGLTTAACIFITSIIGLSVGAGMILTAVVVTVLTIAILSISIIKRKRNLRRSDRDS
ncbi:MAG: MgtC/SapB family protein [Bacteroidales bacterium]|nr:MgtC/SapB family protein [Bacteroidales bacterium]